MKNFYIFLLAIVGTLATNAQTKTWQGPSGGGWNNPAHWVEGAVPVNGDVIVFSGSGGASSINDIPGLDLVRIEFSGALAYNVTGSAITLQNVTSTGVTSSSTVNQTFALSMTLSSASAINFTTSSTGNLTLSGNIESAAGANRGLTVSAATGTTITLSGNLSDIGSVGSRLAVTKLGLGQLTFSDESVYNFTGGLSISDGKVLVNANDSKSLVGTITITNKATPANLEVNVSGAGNTITFANEFTSSGTPSNDTQRGFFTKTGAGTADVKIGDGWLGRFFLNGGETILNSNYSVAQFNRMVMDGGNFTINAPTSPGTGTMLVPHNAGTLTFVGNISTGKTVQKTGTGSMIFTGDKSTNGGIFILEGTFTLNLGSLESATVHVRSGKTFNISGSSSVAVINNVVLKSGAIVSVDATARMVVTNRLQAQYFGEVGPNITAATNRITYDVEGTLEYIDSGAVRGYAVINSTFWPAGENLGAPTYGRPKNVEINRNIVVSMAANKSLPDFSTFDGTRIIDGAFSIAAGARLRLPEFYGGADKQSLTLRGGGGIGDGRFLGSPRAVLIFDRTEVGNLDEVPRVNTTIRFDQDTAFANHIYELAINNNYEVTLEDRLNITDGLGNYDEFGNFIAADPSGVGFFSMGSGFSRFNTGDNLYFLSTRNGTSIFGEIGSDEQDNAFIGNYYSDMYVQGRESAGLSARDGVPGGFDRRQWRMVSIPQRGSRSVGISFQGNGTATMPTLITDADVNGNPIPNQASTPPFGTLITGHLFPNAATANAAGYDFWSGLANTGTSSLRRYTLSGGTWGWRSEPTNLVTPTLDNKESAYMLFIRGNRTHTVPNTNSGTNIFDTVILRSYGTVETVSTQTVPLSPASGADRYVAFGNPYYAPFDLTPIVVNPNLLNRFYYWNPALGSRGGYELFAAISGGYGLNGAGPVVDNIFYLKANQAVIFEKNSAPSAGSFSFTDGNKANDRNVVSEFVPFETNSNTQMSLSIRFKEFLADDVYRDVESAAVIFGETNDAAVTIDDAQRLANFASGLGFGVRRDGQNLSMEMYPLPTVNDTIHFRTLGLSPGKYQFELLPSAMSIPGLEAYLRDNFTGTEQYIDLTAKSNHNFTVTSATASSSASRFQVVFRQSSTLPVTFTDINVVEKSGDASVSWSTATERGVRHFEVEYSPNGRDFAKVGTVAAQNTATAQYNYLHTGIGEGKHFYRVRSVDLDGKTALTKVVNVEIGKGIEGFGVYPTVITEGSVTLRLNSLPKGRYNVQVTDMSGKVMMASPLQHNGGTANQTMRLPAMSNGTYNVRLQGDNGQTYIQRVMKQ